MKIQKEHVEKLRLLVAEFDTPEVRERYRKGEFPRANEVQDLNKRYRWDLLWAVAAKYRRDNNEAWLFDEWGDDVKNSHIDTALRAVVEEL